jgi:hypothetical protein
MSTATKSAIQISTARPHGEPLQDFVKHHRDMPQFAPRHHCIPLPFHRHLD